MIAPFLFVPLAAVMGMQQEPQAPAPDRKVRIEVVTKENGETKRVTKELDFADEARIQEALRELGVIGQLKLVEGERDLTIDIRGFGEGDETGAHLRMAPMPPMPPMSPELFSCEPTAYLGVSTRNLADADKEGSKARSGALVTEVSSESPAAALGLVHGDIIIEIDDAEVKGPAHLAELIKAHQPGDMVKVEWMRGGKGMKGKIALGERKGSAFAFSFDPDDMKEMEILGETDTWQKESSAFLGITPKDEEDQGPGVLIQSVEGGSAAEQMGLQAGDRILSINGDAMEDFDALAERIRSMKPGDEVRIGASREGESMALNGKLGERRRHFRWNGTDGTHGFRMEGFDPESRDAFRREMDQLRREMDQLRRDMGTDLRREVRIHVQARNLSDDEKALLRKKGVEIDNELKLDDLRAFPNPSNGFFRLQFELPDRGDLAVDVHDTKGERVYQERIVGFKGRYERTLDLSDQASGSYFLVITQGGRTATSKLVKE